MKEPIYQEATKHEAKRMDGYERKTNYSTVEMDHIVR